MTILIVIAIMMLLSASTIVLYNLAIGSDRLQIQLVRFGLTCVICWFMYHGHSWARWITIVLLAIAVLITIPTLQDFNLAKLPGLYLLSMTVGYGCAVLLLIAGPGIRNHFTPDQE